MNAGTSTFAGLGDMLASGLDASLTSDAVDLPALDLDLIDVVDQEREEFEDDESSLLELGNSMLAGRQWQQILVRPVDGREKPYELVAGERRFRAARLVGMAALRAFCVPMTDEEAADARFAENIQRKNLTQLEEARRLKHDVDQLGVEGTLAKHHKSHAWLSKRMRLLDLPDHTRRLVAEHISADVELINQVSQIEKRDPAAAEALVSELKATRGKERAREKVAKVKDEVKPSARKTKSKANDEPKARNTRSNTDGSIAEPRDRSSEQPSPVAMIDSDTVGQTPTDDADISGVLTRTYDDIANRGRSTMDVIADMPDDMRDAITIHLREFYDAGVKAENVGNVVIQGLHTGEFSNSGIGAFRLAAFVYGVDTNAKFDLVNVLGCAREE
ncbi:ParB/RepB/Spo0J family partition protein [Burkholderia pseudomallei]|uniref:ParB/RepB/Spo0J family partition protein n=1 Tax=Burkholderia pseudomallei TaxID=28450 RepID=UPI0018A20C06|nr:ParB/RepB/Spo0J family partition protein [Burkholderia pseudomallei]